MTAGTGLDCSLGNFVELAHHLGVEPVVIRTPLDAFDPGLGTPLRISLVAAYGKRLCVDLIELGLFLLRCHDFESLRRPLVARQRQTGGDWL
jgi:hypothetical protein